MFSAWGKVRDKHVKEVGSRMTWWLSNQPNPPHCRAWAVQVLTGMTFYDETGLPSWCRYHDGWNGSYHECWYGSAVVICFGRTPKHARGRVRTVLSGRKLRPHVDACVMRHEVRSLVRPGD